MQRKSQTFLMAYPSRPFMIWQLLSPLPPVLSCIGLLDVPSTCSPLEVLQLLFPFSRTYFLQLSCILLEPSLPSVLPSRACPRISSLPSDKSPLRQPLTSFTALHHHLTTPQQLYLPSPLKCKGQCFV